MKPNSVQDRFGLVYGILVMLGIGTMLPWNVMLTEKEYFDVRLHVEPYYPRVAGNFLSLFGLTFNTANLLAFCFVACLQSGRLSLRAQILFPLVIILMLLGATAGVALRLDLPGTIVAAYSLPTLALLGTCMAVLQGGVLNLACLFPPIYIQGFVVGAGLSGVGTSVLSFITQLRATESDMSGARTPAEVAPAAFAYFATAASVTALCAMAFTMLGRLEFSRARLAAHYAAVLRAHNEQPRDGLMDHLLAAPYDEQTAEEGEGLPGVERYYWPAALIPYLHPATVAPEQSMYWDADPNDELSLLVGDDEPAAQDDDDNDGAQDGASGDEGDDNADSYAVGGSPGAGGAVGRSGSWSSGRGPASDAVAIPTGRRSGTWAVASSAPHLNAGGGGVGSYDSAGSLGDGASSSYRCGTALRFYRSSSGNALRGMLEAALAQQQQQLMWQEQQGVAAATGTTAPAGARGSTGGGVQPGSSAPQGAPRLTSGRAQQGVRGGQGGRGKSGGRGQQGPGGPSELLSLPAAPSHPRGVVPFVLYAVSIVICMGGSLAVWPGVTAFICSVHNPATVSPCAPRPLDGYGRLSGDLWVPAMFVIFALGDVTGRVGSSWGPWGRRPPSAVALLLYSVARLGVVAALLLCHVVTPSPWELPYLLRTDWWPLGLVLALGLTQGHLLSTGCMHAPAVLPPGKEARFGPVTGFCITAGCLFGSVASTLLVEAFTR